MTPWPDPGEPRESEAWLTFEFVGIALAITFVSGWLMWSWLAN